MKPREMIVLAVSGAAVAALLGRLTETPLNVWTGLGVMIPPLLAILMAERRKKSEG